MTTHKFGTNLPPDLIEEFDAFCAATGLIKQRAAAGGIMLILAAPLELRVSLAERTGDPNALEAAVEAALRDAAKPARAPASRRSKGRKVGG